VVVRLTVQLLTILTTRTAGLFSLDFETDFETNANQARTRLMIDRLAFHGKQ